MIKSTPQTLYGPLVHQTFGEDRCEKTHAMEAYDLIGPIRVVKEMAPWFKISLVLMTAFSVAFFGISYASERERAAEVKYGDLRDDYPSGLYITAVKLEGGPPNFGANFTDIGLERAIQRWTKHQLEKGEPTFKVLANDTYVQEAVESGNETWVQQDDSKSEFMNKGKPEIILWKDGNYYFIVQVYYDYVPKSWIHPPSPTETAQLLLIPWTIFLIVGIIQKIRSSLKLTNEHCTLCLKSSDS
jgi:hypothetical protein